MQYTRKSGAGTIKARQVVPGMHWEVVPSPVVEVGKGLAAGQREGAAVSTFVSLGAAGRAAFHVFLRERQLALKVCLACIGRRCLHLLWRCALAKWAAGPRAGGAVNSVVLCGLSGTGIDGWPGGDFDRPHT